MMAKCVNTKCVGYALNVFMWFREVLNKIVERANEHGTVAGNENFYRKTLPNSLINKWHCLFPGLIPAQVGRFVPFASQASARKR